MVWHDSSVSWDEDAGRVSRSYNDWKFVDKDIRAFFKLTTDWATRRYEEIWNNSQDVDTLMESDDVFYDLDPDDFSDKVYGLWPDDYHWILRAAVIRNAVTAFEVYLEKSLDEVLALRLRIKIKRPPGRSPGWGTLVKGHKLIRVDIATERVQHIRALRHMLTHQRGELRTEAMRERFTADHLLAVDIDTGEEIWHRAYVGGKVQLTDEIVDSILDDLGMTVREVDSTVWAVAWGRAPAPGLDELRNRMNDESANS